MDTFLEDPSKSRLAGSGQKGNSAVESARGILLLIREAAISAALTGLVILLLLSPGTLRKMFERAGIQSVKLPWVEIEATLQESQQQLEGAKREIQTTKSALSQARTELVSVHAQVQDVAARARLPLDASLQLNSLAARVANSRVTLDRSTTRLTRAEGTLDRTVASQRILARRIDAATR